MAVGDDATAAGFPLVPDTGSDDAKVKNGAKEINRTRDLIANVKSLVPASFLSSVVKRPCRLGRFLIQHPLNATPATTQCDLHRALNLDQVHSQPRPIATKLTLLEKGVLPIWPSA